MLAASDKSSGVWAYASLEDVQATMAEAPYPAERIHYYKGKVEETIPGDGIPERISILRLDTDWYASTKHELDHLWDRLVPGGVLLLDDYGWWDGAKRAVMLPVSAVTYASEVSCGRSIFTNAGSPR